MLERTQLAPCVHFQPDPDVMSTIWKQAARPSWGGGCEGCVTTLTTTTTIPGLRPCGAPESCPGTESAADPVPKGSSRGQNRFFPAKRICGCSP